MITDNQTNQLFLSDKLPDKFPDFYRAFKLLLIDCGIKPELLQPTNDIWAVDYMPIQVRSDKFVRFKYYPSYLRTKTLEKTISDVDTICEFLGIQTVKSDIILDGGNISRTSDKVIMTEKVFKENPTIERKKLISDLHELLEIDKLYFIPVQPYDFTGHSDGMVRFYDEDTLLINDFSKEKPSFFKAFELAISKMGLNCIRIPYNPDSNTNDLGAKGDYINYLQMEDIVIVPKFGIDEDDIVLRQFEDIFIGKKVTSIDSNAIAEEGGVLNCITWNIRN